MGGAAFGSVLLNQFEMTATLQNESPMLALSVVAVSFILSIVSFILFRFYLVFPASAIDQPLKLGEAWQKMRGNTWRLIGATILAVVIFMGPFMPLGKELDELMAEAASAKARGIIFEGASPAYVLVMPVVSFLMTAVFINVLSNIYLFIMGTPDHETTTAA